jgi:hypothetical protein
MATYAYRSDQEDPAYVVEWSDRDGNLINFATGYTFTLKLVNVATGAVALTKTTNITGAATAPNISVAWAAGDLAVTAGSYWVKLVATASSRDRVFKPGAEDIITIIAAPA